MEEHRRKVQLQKVCGVLFLARSARLFPGLFVLHLNFHALTLFLIKDLVVREKKIALAEKEEEERLHRAQEQIELQNEAARRRRQLMERQRAERREAAAAESRRQREMIHVGEDSRNATYMAV